MGGVQDLLERNREWAAEVEQENPGFFKRSAEGQSPRYLWIGCADSRVPASRVLNLPPGELFVHRNIANLVVHSDLNCLSVMQYAVEALKVQDIIVCGHYGCGGVLASMGKQDHGLVDHWLDHIREVYRMNQKQLEGISDTSERADRLCELNVIRQVANVCSTPIVQQAWDRGQKLSVHGLIYQLKDGCLKDLEITVSGL